MYKYRVIINQEPIIRYDTYEFKDTNTNIIKINENGISIEMHYNGKVNSTKHIINRCKKAVMIYFLKYKYTNSFYIADFYEETKKLNTKDLFIELKTSFKIDNLLLNNTHHFSENFYNDYLIMKSDNPVNIMLNAYVMANSSQNKLEQFLFYWVAFNSIYNMFDGIEREKQEKYVSMYILNGIEYVSLTKKQRDDYMDAIIEKISNNVLRENQIHIYDEFANKVHTFLNDKHIYINEQLYLNNNTNMGKCFILTSLGYFYRCNYLHGLRKIDPFLRNEKDNLIINLLIETIEEELIKNIDNYIRNMKEKNYEKYFLKNNNSEMVV